MCELAQMPHEITIGDTVAYTRSCLDRHRLHTTGIELGKGIVAAVYHLDSNTILADILWTNPAIPRCVNIRKLTRITDGCLPLRTPDEMRMSLP
jgi:hypothetical protein